MTTDGLVALHGHTAGSRSRSRSSRLIHAAELTSTSAHTHFGASPAEETHIIHVHTSSHVHHVSSCSSTDWLFFSASYQCQLNAVTQQWGRGSCHQLLYFYYQSTRWRHEAAVKWRAAATWSMDDCGPCQMLVTVFWLIYGECWAHFSHIELVFLSSDRNSCQTTCYIQLLEMSIRQTYIET